MNLMKQRKRWKDVKRDTNDVFDDVQIGVTIVDDNQWEPEEEFFLKLSLVVGEDGMDIKLGRTSIMEITILDDDGLFSHNNISQTNMCMLPYVLSRIEYVLLIFKERRLGPNVLYFDEIRYFLTISVMT